MAIERLNFAQQRRYDSLMRSLMYKCNHCGHTVNMSAQVDHIICSWCGNYVFKTPKDEFKYRFRQKSINLANK